MPRDLWQEARDKDFARNPSLGQKYRDLKPKKKKKRKPRKEDRARLAKFKVRRDAAAKGKAAAAPAWIYGPLGEALDPNVRRAIEKGRAGAVESGT